MKGGWICGRCSRVGGLGERSSSERRVQLRQKYRAAADIPPHERERQRQVPKHGVVIVVFNYNNKKRDN